MTKEEYITRYKVSSNGIPWGYRGITYLLHSDDFGRPAAVEIPRLEIFYTEPGLSTDDAREWAKNRINQQRVTDREKLNAWNDAMSS